MNATFILLIDAAICAFIGMALLVRSQRGAIGFALGLLLGPFGVIVAAILRLETPKVAPTNARFIEVYSANSQRLRGRGLTLLLAVGGVLIALDAVVFILRARS